jgi:hypothetical protein
MAVVSLLMKLIVNMKLHICENFLSGGGLMATSLLQKERSARGGPAGFLGKT